jgi:hypothetical protein
VAIIKGPETTHSGRSGKLNKKGVTIIELLIYLALFGILLMLIGRQFKGLIGNYSSNKHISKQQTDTRDILGLMVREIRNTGLKIYFSGGSGALTKNVQPGIIANITDSSSFTHGQQKANTYYDTLSIFKIRLNNSSNYTCTDTIKYYVNGTTLWRELKSTQTPKYTNSVVAENVYALQFQYGVIAANDLLCGQLPLTTPSTSSWPVTGTPSPSVSYGTNSITIAVTGAATGSLKYKTNLSIAANRKYTVLLQIDPSGGFPQNLNWLQFSFKKKENDAILGSEKFMPYTSDISITVPVHSNPQSTAYAVLDYSTTGAGTLVIKGFEVRCSELEAYSWKNNPAVADKRNVRAIKMFVLTRTSDKAGTKVSTPIVVGEVSVPRSGAYTWRLYTETVKIPNNGIF